LTPAFAGIGTVGEAVAVNYADYCLVIDASASISLDDAAGLDDRISTAPSNSPRPDLCLGVVPE
jgi:hypothetical protein